MRECRGGKLLMTLAAGAVPVLGCADLATEAERMLAELARRRARSHLGLSLWARA